MIFKPELVELIKQGKKTMTRRPIKLGEKACRYKANHAYSLQSGGKRGDEKITVVAVRRQRLGDISEKDAKREGFPNKQAFVHYWIGLYGHYDPDQQVWVISFVLGDHTDVDRYLAQSPPSQFCAAKLPNGKRCGRAFSDDPEPQTHCRCGAPRPAETMSEIGYTTTANRGLKGEPPAVPEHVQKRFSTDASARDALLREQRRAKLQIAVGRIRSGAEQIPRRELTPAQRKRLKSAEHHLRKVEEETAEQQAA